MKLKPCPFCGGEAKIVFAEEYKQWRIRCKNIDCDVRPSTSWFNNEEEAIDRWNRRKPLGDIVEQLESELYRGMESLDTTLIAFNFGINIAINIVKKGGAE